MAPVEQELVCLRLKLSDVVAEIVFDRGFNRELKAFEALKIFREIEK